MRGPPASLISLPAKHGGAWPTSLCVQPGVKTRCSLGRFRGIISNESINELTCSANLIFFFFFFFFFSSSSASPSFSSVVHHFFMRFLCMRPFCCCCCCCCLYTTIEVVTFCFRGWCVLGVFLLPAFIRLGHECQDLLSACDGTHVC